jgi:nucleotide-binding universal stress UspA family protein
MSPEQVDELNAAHSAHGEAVVQAALAALDLPDAETQVLMGEPATELGLFAQEVGATVLVVGSRGHGALKQAFRPVSALVRNARACSSSVTTSRTGEPVHRGFDQSIV